MATNPADLPSRVEETLAVCPQCIPINHLPLDLAQSSDLADFGSLWWGMLDLLPLSHKLSTNSCCLLRLGSESPLLSAVFSTSVSRSAHLLTFSWRCLLLWIGHRYRASSIPLRKPFILSTMEPHWWIYWNKRVVMKQCVGVLSMLSVWPTVPPRLNIHEVLAWESPRCTIW